MLRRYSIPCFQAAPSGQVLPLAAERCAARVRKGKLMRGGRPRGRRTAPAGSRARRRPAAPQAAPYRGPGPRLGLRRPAGPRSHRHAAPPPVTSGGVWRAPAARALPGRPRTAPVRPPRCRGRPVWPGSATARTPRGVPARHQVVA
ncbi:hypothetical protein SGPA1_41204 [Streptomyces misionensis JCM 4497]